MKGKIRLRKCSTIVMCCTYIPVCDNMAAENFPGRNPASDIVDRLVGPISECQPTGYYPRSPGAIHLTYM